MRINVSQAAVAFLGNIVFAHIATVMQDGALQVTPVWVETNGQDILINSARPRLKTRNMERDGRVAMSIMGMENPRKNLFIRGRVVDVTVNGAIEQINRLSLKYTGNQEYQGFREGEARMLIRIEPFRVFERGL